MKQHQVTTDYTTLALSELVALTRDGDREAFRWLMRQCNQRLYRVARAVLNDDTEAEDALQDAYLNAFTHLDRFRGDAGVTTWLTRIVLNECYRRLRLGHRDVEFEPIDATDEATVVPFPSRSPMDDPVHSSERIELRGLIERAVATLPEPFRVVFVMRAIEECSTEETADTLGIPAATVKTRLFRARRQLRRILQETLTASIDEAFPFLGRRCAHLTDAVMRRIETDFPHPTGE